MATIPDLFAAIEADLTAAGAAQTPVVDQILRGEPDSASDFPFLAYWYVGNEPWVANSLSFTQRQLIVHWEFYIPGSIRANQDSNLNVELMLASMAFAVEAQFMGGVTMSGQATGEGLLMDDPLTQWSVVGSALCRTVGGDIRFQLSNVAPIGA